jgi:hypothetical protein
MVLSMFALADNSSMPSDNNVSSQLDSKIKSYLGDAVYAKNKAFINIIFKPRSDFFISDKVDVIKVITTLKDNGLLNLFYKKPEQLSVSFATNGPPLFFIRIMSQALRSIGYYRYITQKAHYGVANFVWTIDFVSEYAIDPIILDNALHKLGCSVVDISLGNPPTWHYQIDMQNAHLNSVALSVNSDVKVKRSLYSSWFDVAAVKKVKITSNHGNNWYPYVVFYDKYLKILKVLKINKKIYQISLNIPKDTTYMKISDLYNLQNIRGGLDILATKSR